MHDLLWPLVYVVVKPLPALCLPARVIRHAGMTLLWVDPSTLMAELVFWTKEHLTDAERLVMRRAFGATEDLSQPPDDSLLDGTAGTTTIPRSLWLPRGLSWPVEQRTA